LFQASLVDFNGTVVMEKREDLTGIADGPALEARVEDFVVAAVDRARETNLHIWQVFVGLPGILDPHTGMVVNAVNFPALNGIDFQSLMQTGYGLPCRCGSLGLAFFHGEIPRVACDAPAMVLYWDLGIGAVAGVGERVISHTNKDSLLSEIGHVGIVRDGKLCHCGRRGCLEAYTGGWAMIETLADNGIQSLESLRNAVLGGHAAALEVAGAAAYTLGKNLAWPLQVMKSERLIVSGPLSSIYPAIKDRFIEGLSTIFNDEQIKGLNPVSSLDSAHSMQYGAFRCALRQFFYPDE
jgi:predicted NBD/HSP70 family sugar kinase